MPKQKLDILLRSKILVALIAAVLFLLGLALIAQGFIDTRDYRDQIVAAIEETTGQTPVIRGDVTVTLLPVPTIYAAGVELRGKDNAVTSAPQLTIDLLRINASVLSLFSGQPRVSSITLEKPVFEVERALDGAIHWDWIDAALLKRLAQPGRSDVTVHVKGGRVLYRNNVSDHEWAAANLNARGTAGAQPRLEGEATVSGRDIRFALTTAPQKSGEAGLPLSLQLYQDERNRLQLEGRIDTEAEPMRIEGDIRLEMENALAWVQKREEKQDLLEQITGAPAAPAAQGALPLHLSGRWAQEGMKVDLTEVTVEGLNSSGTGTIGMEWKEQLAVNAQLAFSTLDYDSWYELLAEAWRNRQSARTAGFYAGNLETKNPLPEDMQFTLGLEAQKLLIAGQTWEKAQLAAHMEEGAITVNQFSIRLPGQSTLMLFGLISQGSTKEMRFEGSMETQGTSLRNLLTVFDPSAADLPETGTGKFYARANIFVSPEQVRLSEADLQISDLRLSGGLVAYYDANPRVEADVRLSDINFDYFRDAWRERQKEQGKEGFLTFDKSMNFQWLKRLRTTIDFKVHVERFTFLERQGDSASFRIFAREGQFGLYNIRFYYPQPLEANLTLDVTGEQPFVNVLLNADVVDADYFSLAGNPLAPQTTVTGEEVITVVPQAQSIEEVTPPAAAQSIEDLWQPPVKKTRAASATYRQWPEELIDMSWMEGFGGLFDLSIGTLIYDGKPIRNFKLQATLENNLMTMRSLSFAYWQGRCDVTGSLFGGTVPGLAVSFTLYDAEMRELLGSLLDRENIGGKASVSGTLSTSGVNYASWVAQSEAKLVMAARGVTVEGFNLQGAVDAVAVSRTAADVFNNVSLALPVGATQMSVDGNINVKNGVLRTPGITLKSGTITGNLTGEVRLMPWTMDLSTLFQFPTMPSETVPTMTVQLVGPINEPELRLDTSSLEAYVAKRIIGR